MRILIVCLPKSGSSTLASLLSNHLGLDQKNDLIRREACAQQFSLATTPFENLSFWHSDLYYQASSYVQILNYITEPCLLKLHLPPGRYNLGSFDKVIYLYREIDEILMSYKKGQETGVFLWRHPRDPSCALDALMRKELTVLHDFWMTQSLDGVCTAVSFDDMISNSHKFQSLISELGLSDSRSINLPKKRHSSSPTTRDNLVKGSGLSFFGFTPIRLLYRCVGLYRARKLLALIGKY